MTMQHFTPAKSLMASTLLLSLLPSLPVAAQQFADPTRPYSGSVAKLVARPKQAQMQVQAIYHFTTQRLAIIDGALVREGQQVAGMTIEQIADDHVRYRRNGVSGVLRLAAVASSVTPTPTRISALRAEVKP
jgi:hypothetical protein